MTKKEIQTAIVRIAVMRLENPSAKTATLVSDYVRQMHPMTWGLADLMPITIGVERLLKNPQFKAMVKIETQEYIDQESGEVVSVTRVTMRE